MCCVALHIVVVVAVVIVVVGVVVVVGDVGCADVVVEVCDVAAIIASC